VETREKHITVKILLPYMDFIPTIIVVTIVPNSASSATEAVREVETNCGGLSFTSSTVTATGAVVASA